MGYLLLAGGAEFAGKMAEPDLRAIELAGGFDAPIRILPTAAAPDNNQTRAGNNGLRWFRSLGAKDVGAVNVVDQASANDPELAAVLQGSRLIYLLGGFPEYLGLTLANSLAWKSIVNAYKGGAVLAGSSAGAMVLCEHYYDPFVKKLLPGLNLIPRACILPHHDNFGKHWVGSLSERLPDDTLIGIDEATAMLAEVDGWRVYGAGTVTLYHHGQKTGIYSRSELFTV